MGQSLSAPDFALYRAVDEVLHYVWDPIGVSSTPQARAEYHGYLPQVFGLLHSGSDVHAIARNLTQVTTERMGLTENPEHDLEIARVLMEWKEVIREQHA